MDDLFFNLYSVFSWLYGDTWASYLYDINGYNVLGLTAIGSALVMALLFYFIPTVKFSGRKWWIIALCVTFLLTAGITFSECNIMFQDAGSDQVSDCGFTDIFGTAVASGLISIGIFWLPFSLLCFASTHNYKVPYKN